MNRCFNSHSLQPFRLQQLSLANKLHALDTLSQRSIWFGNANQLKILGQRLDSPQFSNSMWMPQPNLSDLDSRLLRSAQNKRRSHCNRACALKKNSTVHFIYLIAPEALL